MTFHTAWVSSFFGITWAWNSDTGISYVHTEPLKINGGIYISLHTCTEPYSQNERIVTKFRQQLAQIYQVF